MKFTPRPILAGALAGLMLAGAAFAELPKGMSKVTSVEGITEYKLENGLQVLMFPDPSQETITVNVTYHVGSKHENYGETGMAHLLEHLVFKGSPRHKDIPKELTDHGAEPNGTTWTDRTNYFETFTATDENLNWALDLEADRMVNSFIAKKDLDSEMSVVRNEMENGENNPIRVLLQRLLAVSFDWHNYGKSTIGARTDVENVDISNLQAFYKKYYQPDNATLIVAGKIDEAETLKLVDKYFAPIPKPKRKLPELYTADPIQDGERQVTVRRPGDVQVAAAMYRVPAGADPAFPAVNVLTQILADPRFGRLQEAVVKKELAAASFGFPFQWAEPGVVTFMAQVAKDQDLDAAKDAMLAVLEDVKNNPITEDEVKQAKANLIKQFELSFNSSEGVALQISEWLGMGDWRLMFLDRDRLEAVTVEQVQAAAEEFLVNDNRSLGLFIPEQTPDRADSITRYSVAEVRDMVKDYKGREAVAQGEDFDPSFENIDARTERKALSNGSQIAYINKKTRGESVVVRISLDMGNTEALHNLSVIGDLTASMLQRGTQRLDRKALQAEFDQLKANVSIGGSARGATASITTTKENLPKVIALLDEVFKTPAFSQEELDVLKQERIVTLEQQKQQPQSQVFRQLAKHTNVYEPGHPRYQMTIDEEINAIKAITVQELKDFHADFYGAQDADIAIVGDFDVEATTAALEKSLGDWNASVKYQRVPAEYNQVDAINKFIDTPDKAGAAFGAMLMLPISDDHEDYPALFMANQMLGGGFISSRLANRLRQQDGLSYGAGSFFQASSFDDRSVLGAYAICAPENLNKVEVAFKEEMEKVLAEGFTEQELKDAKKGVLQNNRIDRAKDNRLAAQLRDYIDLERTQAWNKKYEKAIDDLTILDVNMAFKKYVDLNQFSIIKGGDGKKVNTE